MRIMAWSSVVCLVIVGIAVIAFAAPTTVLFPGEDGGEPLQSSTGGSFITEPDAGWPSLTPFFTESANVAIMDSRFHTIVTIHSDGSVEIAKGVSMNKATRIFWEAIEYANPLRGEVVRLKRENRALRRRLARL